MWQLPMPMPLELGWPLGLLAMTVPLDEAFSPLNVSPPRENYGTTVSSSEFYQLCEHWYCL
jgi:hypothetical protein